jgi:Flp pilus assembly protein TadB
MSRVQMTALLAAACCFLFLPIETAAPAAALSSLGILRWMPRLGNKATIGTAHEQRLALPLALDILALALDAGVAWDMGVRYAADCCTGELERDLRIAAGRLAMGAAPEEVWQGSTALRDIGTVVERSFRSGAGVSTLLRQHADSERATERLRRLENSRRLGTKILMPVSFLGYPAFVVLALIPTLASTAMQLDIGWTSTG